MRSAAAKLIDQADAAVLYRAVEVLRRRGARDLAHYLRATADLVESGEVAPPIRPEHRCDPSRWTRP